MAKARRERRPLTSGQTVRKIHRLIEKAIEEIAGLFVGAVSREVQSKRLASLGKKNPDAGDQWTSYKSGNLCANAVDAELGERIDLTIDSGCAACALSVGVASAVGTQQLNRTPQEYIAANAEKIRELGFKTPTLKFQNGDVQKSSVMDKLHKPLSAACKVFAADNRVVMHPEDQGGSSIEDVRSKRRIRIVERIGVFVLPCCVVKQNSQKRRSSSSRAQTTGRFIRKPNHTF